MSVVSTVAEVAVATFPSVVLVNEGLDPGVRVVLDDRPGETCTVCFAEVHAPYTHVRLESSGERLRVASWRLACID